MTFIKPKITIITVCLNAGNHIANAINSVLNQTYDNIQHVIIDGGSIDSTLNIVQQFQGKYDQLLLSERDNGIYDAMNKGIKLASGEWIYFLGSDDVFINESVISDIFNDYFNLSSEFIYGNVIFSHSGIRYDGKFDSEKISEKNICHQSIFYHKDLFTKFGLFDLKYSTCADHVFNIKCFGSNLSIQYLDIDIAKFNELGISGTVVDVHFVNDFDQLLVDNEIVCKKTFNYLKKENYQIKNSISFHLAKILLFPLTLLNKMKAWLLQKF